MLPLLAALAFQERGAKFNESPFDGFLGPKNLVVRAQTERLSQPKRSPKHGWEFDWNVAGFIGGFKPPNADRKELRFELFSQESTTGNARPETVMRMLLRLFEYNVSYLHLDHAGEFGKVVTVYLCFGGDPGGEQLFDVDNQAGGQKVDTIYFYDLRSLTDPVETVREIAHEYGHAVLPAMGGLYTAPEAWANGYLGEKLYMSYLAQARTENKLGPEETFGASPEALRLWVRKNVDPLVDDALTNGPRSSVLGGKSKASMDASLGLALAMAHLYGKRGPQMMDRALRIGGPDPKSFVDAALMSAEELRDQVTLDIPVGLRNKPIWIPVGHEVDKSRIVGADVLSWDKNGWTRIRPGRTIVIVKPSRVPL